MHRSQGLEGPWRALSTLSSSTTFSSNTGSGTQGVSPFCTRLLEQFVVNGHDSIALWATYTVSDLIFVALAVRLLVERLLCGGVLSVDEAKEIESTVPNRSLQIEMADYRSTRTHTHLIKQVSFFDKQIYPPLSVR